MGAGRCQGQPPGSIFLVEFPLFQLHNVEVGFAYIEQFRDVPGCDHMAASEGRPLMFSRDDFSHVVSQMRSHGLLYRNNLKHLSFLPDLDVGINIASVSEVVQIGCPQA
jgi:hypothetical protein